MTAGVYSPQQAGEGPSIIGVAKAIGSKIRDAAQEAKEEREKADKEGVQVKKGSLFKSALSNKFNPIKSKKTKSNWNKQFSWNQKKSDKPSSVNGQPTGGGSSGGRSGGEKLKSFIAGGFSAILADTTRMVEKLNGLNTLTNEGVSHASRSADTLTIIKETLTTQTDLRRKAIENAKYAQTEKQLEKTKDVAGVFKKDKQGKDKSSGGSDEPGGTPDWLEWMLGGLGLADLVPNNWWSKLNPFSKPKVTTGGTPPGTRMPGTGPRVTTSGGATAPNVRTPGANTPGAPGVKPKGGGLRGGLASAGLFMLADLFAPQINDAQGSLHGLGELSNDELKKRYDAEKKSSESVKSGMFGGLFGNLFVPEWEEFTQLPMLTREMEKRNLPLSEGGIVDNPTETNLYPGDQVIPLNTKTGRDLAGASPDTQANKDMLAVPFKTIGASILGISNRMLKATDSGIAGDMVRQDISKLSRDFGIANVLTTTSLGRANFGSVNTEEKSKNFLKKLFEKVGFNFGDDEEDSGGSTPPTTGATVTGGTAPGEGQFTMTSGFGPRTSPGGVGSTDHQGVDYNAPQGTPLAVLKPGRVAKVEPVVDAASMAAVRITHDDGSETRYGHLSRIDVQEGQQVGANQLIGLSGGQPGTPGAGPSTGPHVHFEYYPSINADPADGSGVAKQYFTLGGTIVGAPSAQPMSNARGGNVAVLALGTNDWGVDSSVPQYNTKRIVKHVKDKGYNPVVIPPFNKGKFKKPREGVIKGAKSAGAAIVNMSGQPVDQYGHNSKQDRQRLGRMFSGALLIGDSNAQGIKYYSPKSKLIGGVGKDTDTIWSDVKNANIRNITTRPTPAPAPRQQPGSSGSTGSSTAARRPPSRPQAPATVPARSQQSVASAGSGGASGDGVNTMVVQAPSQLKISSASVGGTFGSSVPSMPTASLTFSDFLYQDLV